MKLVEAKKSGGKSGIVHQLQPRLVQEFIAGTLRNALVERQSEANEHVASEMLKLVVTHKYLWLLPVM
jgi:hypothetical protein